MAELFPKTCKVFPRNGIQYISGILPKQKRIDLPAELPLNETELRRCLSYATVYESVGGKDVLLTLQNYLSDNTDAEAATDVPEVELSHPLEEEDSTKEKGEETSTPESGQQTSQPAELDNTGTESATARMAKAARNYSTTTDKTVQQEKTTNASTQANKQQSSK